MIGPTDHLTKEQKDQIIKAIGDTIDSIIPDILKKVEVALKDIKDDRGFIKESCVVTITQTILGRVLASSQVLRGEEGTQLVVNQVKESRDQHVKFLELSKLLEKAKNREQTTDGGGTSSVKFDTLEPRKPDDNGDFWK